MRKRKTMTFSALIYTMLKKWKLMLVCFLIVCVVGSALVVLTGRGKGQKQAEDPAASASANPALSEKTKEEMEEYKEYLDNCAYMELNPSKMQIRYITYSVNWKEEGLDASKTEARNASLFQWMTLYYPSDEFANEITAVNADYKKKALYELVGITRGGNLITFTIAYSDDYFLKDLCDVIDSTLKKKQPDWIALAGEYELTPGPVTDKPVDGNISGHKGTQDSKRAVWTQYEAAVTAAKTAAESAASTGKSLASKEKPMSVRLITVFLVAVIFGIVVGGLIAIYDRRLFFATDVEDVSGKDLICIIKKEPESGLDRMFYKREEKYKDPGLFLSILDKKFADEGIKRVFLYSCSYGDTRDSLAKVSECLKGVEVVNVLPEDGRDFFLNAKEDEAVILFVKAGITEKKALFDMTGHLESVGVKCPGTVLEV